MNDARVETTRLLFLANRQTSSYAAHIADLKIKQHKIGLDRGDGPHDVGTVAHPVNEVSAPDGRFDVVNQPVSVGRKKDVGHAPKRTPRQRRP